MLGFDLQVRLPLIARSGDGRRLQGAREESGARWSGLGRGRAAHKDDRSGRTVLSIVAEGWQRKKKKKNQREEKERKEEVSGCGPAWHAREKRN